MKKTTDNFARALSMLREIYCLEIQELAALCGISSSAIHRLEHNVANPSIITFSEITKIFEVSSTNFLQILNNTNKMSNSQILICLNPGRSSETIDPKLSYARVAKLIRVLKNLPYMTAALHDTTVKKRLCASAVNRIEKLRTNPSLTTIQHLCILYGVSIEKYLYYVEKTANMTSIEAAMFIAMDFES